MKKRVVLIFDAAQRSALASTRALGKRSDIVVYTCDSLPMALAGSSAYSHAYLQCPDPTEDAAAFVSWVSDVIEQYSIDFLLPVTEVTSRTLAEHKSSLPDCRLPFASLSTLLQLSNKTELTHLATKLGVPVPHSQYCEHRDEINWQDVVFPCVLKPALSKVLVNNQWLATQVHIVHNEAQMRDTLSSQPYFDGYAFMVQQFIDGHGAGVFCYYQQGQAKAFFAHRRLREKPPSGGVSVLSESAPVDPVMKAHATALLDAAHWHGAAMVEFKVDSSGTPYLMEINTRLWGSLQLAIDAGVSFPELLFDGEYATLDAHPGFTPGVQLRWLLGDLDNLYIQLKDQQLSTQDKLCAVGAFLTPRLSGRRHEINRMDDMGPFWYELKHYF
ncbi:carboxylate--amine ligase [Salinimonas lutimaris]|uniref:carboxylate--amine ligase n=1 Tax=Salinimonas lutimaris TaxID=914153 RepID=UPI0010C13678|nr:ATP-grasp domain-containing protein [Salinimonas lutimaris]